MGVDAATLGIALSLLTRNVMCVPLILTHISFASPPPPPPPPSPSPAEPWKTGGHSGRIGSPAETKGGLKSC